MRTSAVFSASLLLVTALSFSATQAIAADKDAAADKGMAVGPGSAAAAATQAWLPRVELGLTLGYTAFAEVSGLGNSFFKDDIADNAPAAGLRFGYQFSERLSGELDVGGSSVAFRADGSSGSTAGGTATIITAFAAARYRFMVDQKVSPFLSVGLGEIFQMTDKEYVKPFDNDLTYLIAGGVEARLTFRLRARLDIRWLASEGRPEKKDKDTGVVKEAATSVSNHMQVLLGVTYLIGGPDEDTDLDGLPNHLDKCPNKAEDKDGWQDKDGCPDEDNDGDGVPDLADKCANEAEDKDGFQDADGCPEADNDRDGIADAADKCPNEAEDKDKFEDTDGCPDLDNDKDGVPDKSDRCPNKPEDRDGFQDTDGCPELDNDRDTVLDAKDKCPNKAETINGLDDDDGCPDALPDHVARLFDGPLTAIKFGRKGKLKRRSSEILEKLLELLLENETVKIEIHVHVHGKGAASKLKAASLARAAAIRKFYSDAGIDAGRFVLFGHGNAKSIVDGDSKKARAKNTRIELKIHRPSK